MRYIIAAPGCTLARRVTYFHRHAGRTYIAQSPRALAALLREHNVSATERAAHAA